MTGFSHETLKRLITLIRVVHDTELSNLVYKDTWRDSQDGHHVKEWSDAHIMKLIKNNEFFRKGIINIFFEGATIPFLAKTPPLLELKKLSISKVNFELPEMIDTLMRYKEKGSYTGMQENNPEILIQKILEDLGIPFEKGELEKLVDNVPKRKRTMDFMNSSLRDFMNSSLRKIL